MSWNEGGKMATRTKAQIVLRSSLVRILLTSPLNRGHCQCTTAPSLSLNSDTAAGLTSVFSIGSTSPQYLFLIESMGPSDWSWLSCKGSWKSEYLAL